MGILADGAFTLGLMGFISALSSLGMFLYILNLNDGNLSNLKSILLHLMASWFLYYSAVSILNFIRFFSVNEVIQLNSIRLIIAVLICFQLTALYRIYLYIKK